MWMDGGVAGDKRILSEDAIERTLTPAAPMSMLGSDARFPSDFSELEVYYGQMAVLHVPTDNPANSQARHHRPQRVGRHHRLGVAGAPIS